MSADSPPAASGARYRALLTAIGTGFCVVEVLFDDGGRAVDYRFLDANPAFVRQAGFDPDGRRMREIAPDHEAFWFEAYGRVAVTGRAERFTHEAAALGRVFEVFAFPVDDPARRQVGILFTDVTAERAAAAERERLLAESEAARAAADLARRRLEAMVEQLPVGVHIAEAPGGRLVLGNAAVRRIWGGAPASARVEDYSPDYVAYHRAGPRAGQPVASHEWPLARALAAGAVVEGEVVEAERPDGSRVLVSLSASPVRDADGQVVGGVVTSTDVTERERLVEALRAAERRARFLADFGQALQPLADPGAVMATAARLLGEHLGADRCAYAEVEADADHFTIAGDYVRGDGAPGAMPHIAGRFAMSAFGAEALRLHRADEPWVVDDAAADPRLTPAERAAYAATAIGAVISVPLHKDGRFAAGMAVHQRTARAWAADEVDLVVTVVQRCWESVERARAGRAVEEARRAAETASEAKGQFLATMSHELRTPLNAIGGYVQLLELGIYGALTGAQQEALGRVQKAQHHLLGLINDVLGYARLESGRVEYDVRPTRVADVLGDVRPLVEPQMAARGLAFAVHLPDGPGAADDGGTGAPVAVRADREKLGQVLLNLLSNAVKFTAPGGRVVVTLEVAPGADVARLRVADTGRGIPADQLERVFEPFVQVGKRYAGEAPGTGLGLAISRDLARGMGGDLTAESAPGRGSTFTLTLPVA